MSSRKFIREKDTGAQSEEQSEGAVEGPELRATVELRTQAKIDSEAIARVDGVDDHPYGMTLADQEKWEAREAEKAWTRRREDRGQGNLREWLCRDMTEARCGRDERARENPLKQFWTERQRAIQSQAKRLAGRVDCSLEHTAIERLLARRVANGEPLTNAVLTVLEDLYEEAGAVVPIEKIGSVDRHEVAVEGRIETLWIPPIQRSIRSG